MDPKIQKIFEAILEADGITDIPLINFEESDINEILRIMEQCYVPAKIRSDEERTYLHINVNNNLRGVAAARLRDDREDDVEKEGIVECSPELKQILRVIMNTNARDFPLVIKFGNLYGVYVEELREALKLFDINLIVDQKNEKCIVTDADVGSLVNMRTYVKDGILISRKEHLGDKLRAMRSAALAESYQKNSVTVDRVVEYMTEKFIEITTKDLRSKASIDIDSFLGVLHDCGMSRRISMEDKEAQALMQTIAYRFGQEKINFTFDRERVSINWN